jgi:hypothetical protein
MMTTTPRPTHIPVPNNILHDNRLPAGVFRSYVRLLSAADRHYYTHTDPLDFRTELAPLLGLSPSRAHKHLSLLCAAGLLDWMTGGDHCYVIRFFRGPEMQPGETTGEDEFMGGKRPTIFDRPPVSVGDGAGQSLTAVPKGQEAGSPGPEKPNSRFPFSGIPNSPKQDFDDVDGFNLIIKEESLKLQHQQTGSRSGELAANEAADPYQERVFHCLGRAGVWARTAQGVAAQMAANRQRAYNAYLPDLGDLLGWLAFAFAEGRANGVRNPAALVAANLRGDRRCPVSYRPPLVCQVCEREETHCECVEPRLDYPQMFLEFAFNANFDPELETFWGVCLTCHAYPCRCDPDEVPEEE